MNTSTDKDDETRKAAWAVSDLLRRQLQRQNRIYRLTELTGVAWERVCTGAMERHVGHLTALRIHQKTLDPFKFACWLCGEMLDPLPKGEPGKQRGYVIITATLRVLRCLFLTETRLKADIPEEALDLARDLVMEECFGTPRFGVGMNGLYLAFYYARKGYEQEKPVPFSFQTQAA